MPEISYIFFSFSLSFWPFEVINFICLYSFILTNLHAYIYDKEGKTTSERSLMWTGSQTLMSCIVECTLFGINELISNPYVFISHRHLIDIQVKCNFKYIVTIKLVMIFWKLGTSTMEGFLSNRGSSVRTYQTNRPSALNTDISIKCDEKLEIHLITCETARRHSQHSSDPYYILF